ncbi:MAG: protein kinase [Desulfobacterales bacterium]|nr:protein kinase [Desulfobacterales bacterium]
MPLAKLRRCTININDNKIGKYELHAPIGTGYFGTTYKAWDSVALQDVAVKVIDKSWYKLEDFQREIEPLRCLSHKNIIKLLECNFIDSSEEFRVYYIVMELARNGSLRKHIAQLNEARALEITKQMLNGLQYCHKNKVLHSDLKPENVLLDRGDVKIADFGIAKMTKGTVIGNAGGTPQYMAPEQFTDEKTSQRTDLWAVAVILYEMVAKKLPFGTRTDITSPNVTASFDGVACSSHLKELLRTGLAKDEKIRFQTAEDFLQAIERLFPRNEVAVMRAEQGTVGWDWDGQDYDYRELEILFSKPFERSPIVHASFSMIDTWTSRKDDKATRFWVSVESVTHSGAIIKVGTWSGNRLNGCKVQWLAIGT